MVDGTTLPAGCEILILEDDALLRKRLSAHLRNLGAEVTEVSSLAEARRCLHEIQLDFALLDLHLPDGEALDLLRERAFSETTAVVVMTAFGGVKKAVEAMRLGADDYLAKPFEMEELPVAFLRCRKKRVADRRDEHRQRQDQAETDRLFFGESLSAIRSQLETLLAAEKRLKGALPLVLIEGETGTGKSSLARWIHLNGARCAQSFVTVNCAALSETLAETELFGHERGAFTDAKAARIGLFEAADGGTLFLDEIGSLAAATQAKVLVAIEEGRIRRVGANKEIAVDVRLLAASNQPLAELVAKGSFREDLYHRLDLLRIVLPPLRDRGGDIVLLARHLLKQIGARYRLSGLKISPAGESRLVAQPWRGNIRELAHCIERAVIFDNSKQLEFADLGPAAPASTDTWRNPAWKLPEEGFSIDAVVGVLVEEALRETDQNVSAAARRLGVSREFLRYHLSQQKNSQESPQ